MSLFLRLLSYIFAIYCYYIIQNYLLPLIYVPQIEDREADGEKQKIVICSRCHGVMGMVKLTESTKGKFEGITFPYCPICGLRQNYSQIKMNKEIVEAEKTKITKP